MSRAGRLQPVADLLMQAEQQARQRLALREAERAAQRQRLVDLHRYADEYRRRIRTGSVEVATLRDHQQFVARIEGLALAQERVVHEADEACGEAAREVLRCQRRAGGLKRLLGRYRVRAREQVERNEQHVLDDWTSTRRRAV